MSHHVLVHTEQGLYQKAPEEPYRASDPPKPAIQVRVELFKKGAQYAASFLCRREGGEWKNDLALLDVGSAGCSLDDALAVARSTVHLRYGKQMDAGDDGMPDAT